MIIIEAYNDRHMGSQISLESLGVSYFNSEAVSVRTSQEWDPYSFKAYIGKNTFSVESGDSSFWIDVDLKTVYLSRGPVDIVSSHFATVIRGFSPENKSSTVLGKTVLPYISGCSTKQIFHPDRPGDPTWQMLMIPPHTSEQKHHIHSTARCVYVLEGQGICVVGMGQGATFNLEKGGICILDPMVPHHFETKDEHLVVLPVHVWSTASVEQNHPMFNGTFKV